MEPVFQAHPIPQNVTNFEFHLVGDMTLKQFGYLAAGLGIAFLVFTTLVTVQPIIAWPIIIISALLGVAFAFLPIQERPLDHWVAAFFRAIFKPTSLKYSSKIIDPKDPLFNKRLTHYLKTYKYNQARQSAPLGNPNLYPISSGPVPSSLTSATATPTSAQSTQKKQSFMDKFKAGQTSFGPPAHHLTQTHPKTQTLNATLPISSTPLPAQTPPPQKATVEALPPINTTPQSRSVYPEPGIIRNVPVINQLPKNPDPVRFRPTPLVTKQPSPQPATPAPQPASTNSSPEDLKKTVELANKAQETQLEIAKIEASLSQIKQQAAQPGVDPKTYIEQFEDLLTQLQKLNEQASDTAEELAKVSKVINQPTQPQTAPSETTNAAPVKAKSIPTLKLTSFPNVINGIVTDSQDNYIEGAIVVAHDKQGLPVRALKSNKLGQFVAATPLPNGEYSIVVEKDSLSFDKVGIELKNEVLPPILVTAKKMVAAT